MPPAALIYADPQRFAAWLEAAAPGDTFLYAIAASLDQDQPVVAAVSRAREAGQVVTVQGGKPGERRYQVQKSRAAPQSATALPRLSRAFAATPEGALFALLCEIAEARLPCPSDAELARRLEWSDRRQVQYRRERLEASGHIAVRPRGGPFDGRDVIIIETGARTAPPRSP